MVWIVGRAGRPVEPRRPDAFAAAILELIGLPEQERSSLSKEARGHIQANFELASVVRQYEQPYLAAV